MNVLLYSSVGGQQSAAFHSDWLKFGSSLQRDLKFPKSSKSSSVLHLYFSLYRCFVGSSLALSLILIAQHFLSFVSVVRSMPVQPSRASFLIETAEGSVLLEVSNENK
jgi:hypothetical protein